MNNENLPNLQGVNVYDDKLVKKTGFGCGCDITQEIANNNCKTQILDYGLLKNVGGIEVDDRQERVKTIQTGEDYSRMSNSINRTLAGSIGISFGEIAFSKNLEISVNSKTTQLDIYEYGMTMILQKMYALNIKPVLLSSLKEFVSPLVWSDINATGKDDRTNKADIKQIFKKYGTHITTKAFYGCMYQYTLIREQNEWESSMEKQLKIGSEIKVPIPDTGMTVDEKSKISVGTVDEECYKNSQKIETERRVGGNYAGNDLGKWLDSCRLDDSNSMAMLGYVFNASSSSAEESGLIPLYELLAKDDSRKNAMKEAMDEYIKENSLSLETRKMVITDVYAKLFGKGEKVPSYCYGIDGDMSNHRKYFKIEANIFDYVTASTKGSLYFYYALGHAVNEAITDIQIMHTSKPDGSEWIRRGNHSNEGVTGCLDNNVLAIKRAEIKNGIVSTDPNKLISGFGVKANGNLKLSKGTTNSFDWKVGEKGWYSGGLVHKDVKCVTTTDTLKEF